MKKYIKHFLTITRHKFFVMVSCFKAGIVWQGIVHDNSKYSIAEFASSAKYFQGDKSHVEQERQLNGYSLAWQNHKAKNKHHWHYWTDFEGGNLVVIKMPPKYLIEMVCDWVGAGKAYNKGKWTIETFKEWYLKSKKSLILHASTAYYIDMLMKNVKTEGELYEKWLVKKRIEENYALDIAEGCAYQPILEIKK